MTAHYEEFVTHFKKLLEIEKQCEVDELQRLLSTLPLSELERRGLALRHLELVGVCSSLGGHILLTFQTTQPLVKDHIRESKFGSGDIVAVIPESEVNEETQSKKTFHFSETGVVYRVGQNKLQIALKKRTTTMSDESLNILQDNKTARFTLTLLTNDVTYKRMEAALLRLQHNDVGPATRVLNVLFGISTPSHGPLQESFVPFNVTLNQSQRDAVIFALSSQDVALIHGPPGTGKTTTVIEVIEQTVHRGGRVLVTAPSNVAVDNLTERLAKSSLRGLRFVRLGHPARLLPSVLNHSLDAIYAESDAHNICKDIQREMDALLRSLKEGLVPRHERKLKWEEFRTLRRELKQRQNNALVQLIRQCAVILTTCVGAGDRFLQHDNDFDLVVIDEATQATQPQALIPLLKGRRLLLAGDHNQLPPTIHSIEAQQQGLGISFFEKLISLYGDQVSRMLTIQYRMNEQIMQWASRELYANKLQADLVFIDTAGCGLGELYVEDNESKANEGEADVVKEWTRLLVTQSGVAPHNIAVITPYLQQVNLLRQLLWPVWPEIEINTVDSFQGREKECIILSLVRSNREREVGFLKDERRLNVAITRARRQCTIIGDSETLSSHPFLSRLILYFQQYGEHWSAQQFLPNITHYSVTRDEVTCDSVKSIKLLPKTSKPQQVSNLTNKQQQQQQPPQPQNTSDSESNQFTMIIKDAPSPLSPPSETVEIIGEKKDKEIVQDNEVTTTTTKIPFSEVRNVNHSHKTSTKKKKSSSHLRQKKQEKAPFTENSLKNYKLKKIPNEKEKFRDLSDDDSVLDEVLKYQNVCHYPGCKEWTIHVVGSVCQFCKEKFCYKHAQYEVHGCGSAAAQRARMIRQTELEAIRNSRTKVISNNTNKPPSNWERQVIADRLHKKIQEQKAMRTKKPKNDTRSSKK